MAEEKQCPRPGNSVFEKWEALAVMATNGDEDSAKWLYVRNLPEDAKSYIWFKQFHLHGDVVRASFFGWKKGQERWCLAECGTKWEAISLKKELDGKDLGGDNPLSVKTVTNKEKDELVAKQGDKGDAGSEDTSKDKKEKADKDKRSRSGSKKSKRSQSGSKRKRSSSKRKQSQRQQKEAQPQWQPAQAQPESLQAKAQPKSKWTQKE